MSQGQASFEHLAQLTFEHCVMIRASGILRAVSVSSATGREGLQPLRSSRTTVRARR